MDPFQHMNKILERLSAEICMSPCAMVRWSLNPLLGEKDLWNIPCRISCRSANVEFLILMGSNDIPMIVVVVMLLFRVL